jgi:hypothetical protein
MIVKALCSGWWPQYVETCSTCKRKVRVYTRIVPTFHFVLRYDVLKSVTITAAYSFQDSCFAYFWPWRWRRHSPPKHRAFSEIHNVATNTTPLLWWKNICNTNINQNLWIPSPGIWRRVVWQKRNVLSPSSGSKSRQGNLQQEGRIQFTACLLFFACLA